MLVFEPGKAYTRADVKEMAGLNRNAKGGMWDTGVVEYDNEFVIFTNVGIPGRTGHNYDNQWEGDLLHWYHKQGSSISWPSVQRLLENERIVHLFWRASRSPSFEYAGQAKCVKRFDTSPVEVIWSFADDLSSLEFRQGPDEIPANEHTEGNSRQVTVNRYERSMAARRECIAYYGAICSVCDFSFEGRYGALGVGFIHVHHIIPIANIGANYKINPIEDLRPICPNCHAMIHRRQPPFSIEDIKGMIRG